MSNSELLQHKRDIRMRIGRMRRRINNRLHGAQSEGRRLLSWRQYVSRYPSYAILAAFCVGLAASGGFQRARLLRRLGLKLVRHGLEHAGQDLWREFRQAWSQSGAKQ